MKRTDYEKYETWKGTDASIAESLCEYGFIMKWNEKNDEFSVIVRDDHNVHEQPMYCFECFNFEQWIEDLSEGDTWVDFDEILSYVGANSAEEYLRDVRPELLLSDLLSYYGKTNVLGEEYYSFMPLGEVIERYELDKLDDFSDYL